MKVAIYGNPFDQSFNSTICNFFVQLKQQKIEVDIYIYKPFYLFILDNVKFEPQIEGFFEKYEDFERDFDFMFSIGGDGTFLETIAFVRDSNIPIIGINAGRLGFLASISHTEISQALCKIFEGRFSLEKRTLIQLHTQPQLFGEFNYALNELTIHKRDTSSMIVVHTYLNDVFLNSYWADGLIIATPTGSTAYSLSAGGPIVMPTTQNFIILPIAPHNLTMRPIVVPDEVKITLKVEGRSAKFLASLDHRSEVFDSSYQIELRKANFGIQWVKLEGQNFCDTLRNKLMWGADKRNY